MNLVFCFLIAAAIVGIPVFLLIFEIKRSDFNNNHCDDARNGIFLSFKDFINFYNLNPERYEKVKKKYKHNEDMRGMLELVQKDIDSIRKQAEKEIREAERITNEIGRRL